MRNHLLGKAQRNPSTDDDDLRIQQGGGSRRDQRQRVAGPGNPLIHTRPVGIESFHKLGDRVDLEPVFANQLAQQLEIRVRINAWRKQLRYLAGVSEFSTYYFTVNYDSATETRRDI